MFNFPATTELKRFIPKSKILEQVDISPQIKSAFTDDVERITWIHKISPKTMHISSDKIEEIEVFHIELKKSDFNLKILETIDNAIPYIILFVVQFDEIQKVYLAYKEQTKIVRYFSSELNDDVMLNIKNAVQATKTDTIYTNLLSCFSTQIRIDTDYSLAEQVDKTIEIDRLEKQVNQLIKKMKSEKQFNRQTKINAEIRQLTAKILELKDE